MDATSRGDGSGGERRATLRRPAASLTPTAGPVPPARHGRRARKGAR
ncbi:DUF6380 family protein [Streptomyces griseoviridis]